MNLEQRRANIRKKRNNSFFNYVLIVFSAILVLVVLAGGKDYQQGLAYEQQQEAQKQALINQKLEEEERLFLLEVKRLKEIEKLYGELTVYTKLDEAKEKAIKQYFKQIGGAGCLEGKEKIFIQISKMYDIDPFRPISIALWETDRGTSYATKKQYNISGMNNSSGKKTDIYNLRYYTSIDESIHHLVYKLATLYRDKWGLVTLTDIQKRYAPDNDIRNGLDGMDNSIWLENTIKHYRGMENIYNQLKEEIL